MGNNPDIPEGWAIPDDLAKKVSEVLNKKSITPEEKLQDALADMARDITLIEPDPEDWVGWVIYFLEKLDEESNRRGKGGDFEEMLETLNISLGS